MTLAQAEYGADLVANSRNADITPAILKKTGGINAVVDLVASEQTSALALGLLSHGGTYVNVGLFGGELRIPLPVLILRQLTIHGSLVGTLTEMRELIDYQSKTSRSSVRYSYGLQYCSDSHPAGCADRNQAAFFAAV